MQVGMLGPLEVRDSTGAVLEMGGARLRALLIMLALRPGQLVPASQLIDGLWGEHLPAEPHGALQALVSRLRRAVPEAVIVAHQAGYQLMLDREATDVARFERLAAAGRRQLATDPRTAAGMLREALALWRGPALPDVAGTEAGEAILARLDELRLIATQDRIAADLRLGAGEGVVAELEGLVAEHPLREPLAGLLMQALRACGRRAAALEVYERTRKRLVEELGAEPSAGLAALHLELLREDADEPARPVTNLPAAVTSFVGRDADLAQVATLLAEHRLVTLTGPGGSGKTRLAIEAARGLVPRAPDGLWLAELATVSDPAEVAPAVLAALGLREQVLIYSGRPGSMRTLAAAADPLGRLIAALASKQVLLVLDNCEHLVGAAAELAERVLAACPRVRILATSREPLNITGETLLLVGPLQLPSATLLLAQRASAVCPGFEVTPDIAPAVTRICRALDGMPLAIELAAARMRTMGPEQVAARLDDRFRLLTGGSRTALPRHRTLRAVVDWSWDLLDEAEQVMWRRFAVFSGGATVEAAEQICAGGPIDGSAVLDLLTSLADKSVLTVRFAPDGPRYRMLEIIRAYGQERLAEADERETLRAAHAGYYAGLAGESQDHLLGSEQLDWLRRLSADQENLHAAIRGAVAAGDARTAIRLTGGLGWYWWLRSMKVEGAELCAAALSLADSMPPSEELAVAYAMGGIVAFDTPRFADTPRWLRSAIELTEVLPDAGNPVLRLIRPLSGLFASLQGAHAPPSVFDDAVLDPHRWVGAIARILRGQVTINFGRLLDQAESDFRAAGAVFADLGERWGMAAAAGGLAMLETTRGDYAAAIAHQEHALALAAELGTIEDEAQFRVMLARQLWLAGQRERASAELDRAQRDAERIGWPETQAFAAFTAGDLARLDGRLDQARMYLLRAAELAAGPGIAPQLRAVIATGFGLLAGAEGHLAAARQRHAEAWAAVQPTGDAPRIAEVLTGLADLAVREEDPGRAAELLGAGAAIRGTTDRSALDGFRVEAAARAALGDTGFDRAYQRGLASPESVADLIPGA